MTTVSLRRNRELRYIRSGTVTAGRGIMMNVVELERRKQGSPSCGLGYTMKNVEVYFFCGTRISTSCDGAEIVGLTRHNYTCPSARPA